MRDNKSAVDIHHSRLNVSTMLRHLRDAVKTTGGRTATRCAAVAMAGLPARNQVQSGIWAIVKGKSEGESWTVTERCWYS